MTTHETSPAHTPTPWVISEACSRAVRDQHGEPVAVSLTDDNAEADANAKFIVRACNSHDMLLIAVQSFLSIMNAAEHEVDGFLHLDELDTQIGLAKEAFAKANEHAA